MNACRDAGRIICNVLAATTVVASAPRGPLFPCMDGGCRPAVLGSVLTFVKTYSEKPSRGAVTAANPGAASSLRASESRVTPHDLCTHTCMVPHQVAIVPLRLLRPPQLSWALIGLGAPGNRYCFWPQSKERQHTAEQYVHFPCMLTVSESSNLSPRTQTTHDPPACCSSLPLQYTRLHPSHRLRTLLARLLHDQCRSPYLPSAASYGLR